MFSFSKSEVQWANRQHFGDTRSIPCESKLPLGSWVSLSSSKQGLLASLGLSAASQDATVAVFLCLCHSGSSHGPSAATVLSATDSWSNSQVVWFRHGKCGGSHQLCADTLHHLDPKISLPFALLTLLTLVLFLSLGWEIFQNIVSVLLMHYRSSTGDAMIPWLGLWQASHHPQRK